MSLELSKEMLSVEGYLTDARLIFDKQIGKGLLPDAWARSILELARMLQIEHQHNLHKKPRPAKAPERAPEKALEKVSVRRSGTDQVMTSARANPQVPPMISSSPEVEVVRPKRSHSKKVPVAVVPQPRVRKAKPKAKAEPKRKSSRRR